MTEIVQFPGGDVRTAILDGDIDEVHAEAFRDLEGHIGDCVCMAQIAAQRMSAVDRGDEELAFSVFHLTEMLLNLQKYYRDAWDGGNALAYRLIKHPTKTTREIKEAYVSLPAGDPA